MKSKAIARRTPRPKVPAGGRTQAGRSYKAAGDKSDVGVATAIRTAAKARSLHRVKPIEEIAVGDWVSAWDEATQRCVRRRVDRLFRQKDKPILSVVITTSDLQREIEVTPEHPFYVQGRGWVPANELVAGDILQSLSGGAEARVDQLLDRGRRTDVFNFEVQGVHNYFVGHEGVLVHNASSKSAFVLTSAVRLGTLGGRLFDPAGVPYVGAHMTLSAAEMSEGRVRQATPGNRPIAAGGPLPVRIRIPELEGYSGNSAPVTRSVDFPNLPYDGFPVPVRTGSRADYQLDDLDQVTVDPHFHPGTVWADGRSGYSGYSNLPAGDMSLESFLDSRGRSTYYRLSAITQSLNKGCCPVQPYYLAKVGGKGGYTLDPVTVELLPGGRIRVAKDLELDPDNGRPAKIRAGTYDAFDLNFKSSRSPNFPSEGIVNVEVNIMPSADLVYEGAARQRDLIDHIGELVLRRPDLKDQVSISLTNPSPRLMGGVDEIKNALAYSMQRFGIRGPKFDGLGEINYASKEAVELMLTRSGVPEFDWRDSGHAKEYLRFLNDEVGGGIATVHMDAGNAVHVGMRGVPQQLLVHGPTEYTNVEPFLNLVSEHPNVNFVWAHAGGLSRSGYPGTYKSNGKHTDMLADALARAPNLYVDMSWDTVASKVVADNRAFGGWAEPGGAGVMNRFGGRFLFGTDAVGQKLQNYSGPLRKYHEGGIITNLNDAEAFLRTNALRLIRPSVSAFDRYMQANANSLLARKLTGPWAH